LKIETTPRDDHQVRIVAEIEPEVMENFKRKAARKISQDARIPGFRPGKAPYEVVRRTYGEDAIQKEAIELMLDELYPKVLKEAAIEPSGTGNLEEIISTNPPKFAFVVPLMPTTNLGDYYSIRSEYNPPVVTEDQVDQILKNLRSNYSTAEPVERPAEEGDLVSVKVSGVFTQPVEGEEPVAIKENTVQLILGENEFEIDDWPFDGFSRELLGLTANEEKIVIHTFGEDDVEVNLRGKEVEIKAFVASIKHLNIPELTDSFAQTLGEYKSVEDLRSSVQKNLQENELREYDNNFFTALVDQVIGMSEVKYPPQILEEEIERVLHSLEHDLEDRKMDLPTYLKTLGKEKDVFIQEDITPVAQHRLERSLIMDGVAKAENVRLDSKELQTEVAATMQIYQSDPEVRKLKGQQAQNFIENLTMETASRMLNRIVMGRLKTIAAGEAVATAELAGEEVAPQLEAALQAEAAVPEETASPSEAALQVEAAEETEIPAEDTPAKA